MTESSSLRQNTEERLTKCFTAAFPALPSNEIRIASMASVAGWDSLAMITIIGLVEEEFDIVIEAEDTLILSSFELILDFIIEHSWKTQ